MTMHKIMGAFFVLFFLASCNNDSEEVLMNNLNGKWNKKTEQKFDFKVTDAQNPKNIIFVVRNNNDYPYSNIRLIVNFLDGQTKKKSTDTLNYILAEPNGAWIGKGFGDTKEILFQYKLDYKFPANGDYSIGIIQAMRNDNLPGIEDIGVKIETAKP
ncbi:gliding motility lipoprotein GldH [Kaistella flava (ex Peng et al. 2021)]|uniref:Gliding motility lipoprotein GldH n=2 Tax=Kaistella flava (ex Peng et al. 2021) TaxID=2038776 RepID=A0A7M2YBU4_9FLAO|nr:gliding motility lipoprotein GldH [Kaistella flava (ex Peng et al. 2021)]QOW11074.1 gliding motility lipoprotein GldH [Kaistella flava (ex Peng et al. 2021)]